MNILYVLIPLSVGLMFFILGALAWAAYCGQFENLESEGERILRDDAPPQNPIPTQPTEV